MCTARNLLVCVIAVHLWTACAGTEQPTAEHPTADARVERRTDHRTGTEQSMGPATRPATTTSHMDVVNLPVGGHTFKVELARTAAERERGLMFRRELDADSGMLFIFEESAARAFWMRNTYIPLSIAYIDARGRILEIHDMEPLSETLVRSRSPAKYALEVNKGRFSEVGITPGDMLDLSVIPQR